MRMGFAVLTLALLGATSAFAQTDVTGDWDVFP